MAPTSSANGSSAFASSSSIAQIAMKLQVAEPAAEPTRVTPSTGRSASSRSSPQTSVITRRTRRTSERLEPRWARVGAGNRTVRWSPDQRPLRRPNQPGGGAVASDGTAYVAGGDRRFRSLDSGSRASSTACGSSGGVSVVATPRSRSRSKSPRSAFDISFLWLCSFTRRGFPRRPLESFLVALGANPAPGSDRREPEQQRRHDGERAVDEHRCDDLGIPPAEPDEDAGQAELRGADTARRERDQLQGAR